MQIQVFTFNPFQENTYVVWDQSLECIIIDPGCYTEIEKQQLLNFITENNLNPKHCWLTHAHLDHIFGLNFVEKTWNLKPHLHPLDKMIYDNAQTISLMYGVPIESLPVPDYSFNHHSILKSGTLEFEIRFSPGHSPGSICLIHHASRTIFAGDVLFAGSIGRTDLPGGHYQTLIDSINRELMTLADDYIVYSGHGPETEIGIERVSNPFLM